MKKLLAALLSLVMIVSLIPAAAALEDEPIAPEDPPDMPYYLVGTMTNWTPMDDYMLSGDEGGELTLDTFLPAEAEVKVNGGNNEWSSGDNYKVAISGQYHVSYMPGNTNSLSITLIAENGYYLVGTMTNWAVDANFKLSAYMDGAYSLSTTLAQNDEMKIVSVSNSAATWLGYNNYMPGISGAARIYFLPNASYEDGWYDCILRAVDNETAAYDGRYFLVGTMNGWEVSEEYELTEGPSGVYSLTIELPALGEGSGNYECQIVRLFAGLRHFYPGNPTGNTNLIAYPGNTTFSINASNHAVSVAPLYDITVDSAIANGTVSFTTESGAATQAHEGETVTITATPDSGCELARLTVMQGETAVDVAADNTFTMPGGSVTISAKFKRNDTPVLQSVNLHDEGKIGVTFKLTLPSGVNASDVSVELSVGGTVTTPALGAPDNNGVYSVSTSLPARKMDVPIILKTKVGGEYRLQGSMGTDFSQDGYPTSISACCDSYMARYEEGSTVYNLAEAMKIYGTNAHAYLDHVGSTIKTFEDFDDYSLEINDMPAGITLTSVYLTLKDNTDLNLRFTLADGYSADDFTFYCDVRGDLTPTVSGSTATVKIAGIPAAQLDEPLSVHIQGDPTDTRGAVSCAPLYYGKLAMQTDDDALKDVVGALSNYSWAAYYFWAMQG